MSRLILFNDPHFSRHPPECRAESYPHEILDKMHECAALAVRLKAQAVGCSGDWFHRKGKVTFAEANDVLAAARSWRAKGLDVFGILGNHDIAGHSLDSLDNRAVGTLVHSRVLQLLDHEPYRCASPDGEIYVTGTSYFHGCDHDDIARIRMYGAETPWERGDEPGTDTEGNPAPLHVHVAHGTLVRREFFEEYTVMSELVEALFLANCLPDVIVCGHLHYSEGVQMFPRPDGNGEVAICRVGSLGRVSSDDVERQPQALVIAAKWPRFICKAVPIGKDPKKPKGQAVNEAGETREEHEERIQDFVRILREEADTWSVVDHSVLLGRLATEMALPEEALAMAVQAVERRQ